MRLRRFLNSLATVGFTVAGAVAIVFILLIFLFTFREALPIFTDPEIAAEANLHEFFVNTQDGDNLMSKYIWQPTSEQPKLSFIPLIMGTLKATLVGMLVACPLGVAAALFISEFASRRVREVVKPVIELLAGIPSVVLGFFALMVLATWFQEAFGFTYRLNGYNAGFALGIALIPIVFTISEDGMAAVPNSYRAASLALGGTKLQTAVKIVLPAAMPAIFASFVLAFGRAIGETRPPAALGLLAAPTVTSSRFELAISRAAIVDDAPLLTGDEVFVMLEDVASGDVVQGVGPGASVRLEHRWRGGRSPMPAARFEREHAGDLRLMTWNVLDDRLVDPEWAQPFRNVLRAIDADIICFQELWNTDEQDVLALVE